jgi:hypothetical protein
MEKQMTPQEKAEHDKQIAWQKQCIREDWIEEVQHERD